jgi:hypothetical protein
MKTYCFALNWKMLVILTGFSLLTTGSALAHSETNTPPPADDTKWNTPVTTGSGVHTYQTVPNWAQIPGKLQLGPTHGSVIVDKQGLVYVSTDSTNGFYVFGADGKLLKTMAPELSGVHGMVIREENGKEYVYGGQVKNARAVKFTLAGEIVLSLPYPKEANAYPEGKGYKPTSVAVAPNGDIFVADGYGLSLIHKYDAKGNYLKTFGGKGKEDGKFMVCHGIAIDTRPGKPLLLVCDRENRRLQHYDLDGNFIATLVTNLRRPCAVSIHGDNVAIAELEGRVTILDKNNQPVSYLGDNPDRTLWAKFDVSPDLWQPGVFTAPHGLTYDAAGNLYVQDWNKTGRVTKLIKANHTASTTKK